MPQENVLKTIVVGVTGASGAVFARSTLQMLEADARVGKIHLVISGSGLKVLREELGVDATRTSAIPRAGPAAADRPRRHSPDLLDGD